MKWKRNELISCSNQKVVDIKVHLPKKITDCGSWLDFDHQLKPSQTGSNDLCDSKKQNPAIFDECGKQRVPEKVIFLYFKRYVDLQRSLFRLMCSICRLVAKKRGKKRHLWKFLGI